MPRRVVANMLRMSAGEIGDPMAFFVLMEAGDGLEHGEPEYTLEYEPDYR